MRCVSALLLDDVPAACTRAVADVEHKHAVPPLCLRCPYGGITRRSGGLRCCR